MPVNTSNGLDVLADQYRCPEGYGTFRIAGELSADAGYFRFGKDAVCYGRSSEGALQKSADGDLYDALRDLTVRDCGKVLPFDPTEVIDNLRYERYMNQNRSLPNNVLRKAYYTFRPFMGMAFRKHLQRIYLNYCQDIAFPRWPLDRTVENIFEQIVRLSLESGRARQMPFVWFWPSGYSGCVILTHDIETAAGRDFCPQLIDMDAAYGMKSSFQVVPEERYEVTPSFLDSLRARDREVNIHGLNHDGRLFEGRETFLRQVQHINRYAKEYGAAGFRSPVMYRNLEWYGDLEFSYDMSVPNCANLDPQRGGCCTVMPYFIGDILELPLTMIQDYSLFNILKQNSIELWKQQIDLVLEKHGLVSFNIHPDYILAEPCRKLYEELLAYLATVCADRNVWIALPKEVDQWWRQRRKMQVISKGKTFQVCGAYSERAVVAHAAVEGGRVVYEFARPQPVGESQLQEVAR
jgi:hypothetical protein